MLKLDNAILTPHTATIIHECVTRMRTDAAGCVLNVFAGREPPNVAKCDVLKHSKWNHIIPIPLDEKK